MIRGALSTEEGVQIAGDPLLHDIIVAFGNESYHWYAVLIDNRFNNNKVNSNSSISKSLYALDSSKGKVNIILVNFKRHRLYSHDVVYSV